MSEFSHSESIQLMINTKEEAVLQLDTSYKLVNSEFYDTIFKYRNVHQLTQYYGFTRGFSGETMYATDKEGATWWVAFHHKPGENGLTWYKEDTKGRRERQSPLTEGQVRDLFTKCSTNQKKKP